MCVIILNNTLLTAQENQTVQLPSSKALSGDVYVSYGKLSSPHLITDAEKDSLRLILSGVKYAIIELSAVEQKRADAGQYPIIEHFADYLQKLGFKQVVYQTADKNRLILSAPTYCDFIRVRFKMAPKLLYFENFQLSLRTCNDNFIEFTYKDRLDNNEQLLQNLENLWSLIYNTSFSYDIQNRLQLPVNRIIATKKDILAYLKENTSSLATIEGIFEKVPFYDYNEKKHTVAIVKNTTGGYNVIYIDGASNYLDWKEGEWMGEIQSPFHKNTFEKVKWIVPNKTLQKEGTIKFRENNIILQFKNHYNAYIYKKLDNTEALTNKLTIDGKGISGSGILVDKRGYIITSYNVIEGANGNSKQITVMLPKLNNETDVNLQAKWSAKIVKADSKLNLALLQIDTPLFNICDGIPYQFESKEADIGEKVFTLGYPLVSSMGMHPKLAVGAISSVRGYKNAESYYQTSVQVYAGNSGSPLFDYQGNLLGILKSKHVDASKVSYALKSSAIIQFLEQTGLFDINELLTSSNTLKGQPFTEQIKLLQPFVFYISCY